MKPPIFVPDAHTRACIAVIRSLGRAGYEVHAGSSSNTTLGLKSNFANHSTIYPKFDNPDFLDWMRNYVAQNKIKMIIPTSGVLHALKPAFSEFKPLLPIMDDEDALFSCFRKTDVVAKFMGAAPSLGLMDHHPKSVIVDLKCEIKEKLLPASATGYYIKAEHLTHSGSVDGLSFAYAKDPEVALHSLKVMSVNWMYALVQEACSGYQVGVSVLMDNGNALAVSCVRDCYPRPHSKGTMSLRKSCWYPEVANDAIKRLAFLNWKGCAMGEYRYDEATGTFHLIEINFRYWQYLHLDLWSGMDFPKMQAEWFLEGRNMFNDKPILGIVCRDTWPGEVSHLVNELRRCDLGFLGRLRSIFLFFARFFNPKIHQDFLFPKDRKLYLLNFLDFLRNETAVVRVRLRSLFSCQKTEM